MDDDIYLKSGDDDLSIPRATINKMLKEIIAHTVKTKRSNGQSDDMNDKEDDDADNFDLKIANDVREFIADCLVEFVKVLSTMGQEISERENKKMVTPQHIMSALQELGFGKYIDSVKQTFDLFRLDKSERGGKNKKHEDSEKDREDKMLEQERLFAESRKRLGYAAILPTYDDLNPDATQQVQSSAGSASNCVEITTSVEVGSKVGEKRNRDVFENVDEQRKIESATGFTDPFEGVDDVEHGEGFTDPFQGCNEDSICDLK